MIRTVTYDTDTHKIVPLEPSLLQSHCVVDWNRADKNEYIKMAFEYFVGNCVYKLMVKAAPEYQDTCTDGGKCGAGGYCENCTQEPVKDDQC